MPLHLEVVRSQAISLRSLSGEAVGRSGLNHLGTTTTPEFGLTGTTESLKFGATKNP